MLTLAERINLGTAFEVFWIDRQEEPRPVTREQRQLKDFFLNWETRDSQGSPSKESRRKVPKAVPARVEQPALVSDDAGEGEADGGGSSGGEGDSGEESGGGDGDDEPPITGGWVFFGLLTMLLAFGLFPDLLGTLFSPFGAAGGLLALVRARSLTTSRVVLSLVGGAVAGKLIPGLLPLLENPIWAFLAGLEWLNALKIARRKMLALLRA